MGSDDNPADNIDEYIAGFPEDVQAILEKVRRTIARAAPGAQEAISYRIPAFRLNNTYLIYFAAFKKHIGLYPVPQDTAALQQDLALYGAGKATLRFPLHQPMPFELIARVVKMKVSVCQPRVAGTTRRKARP